MNSNVYPLGNRQSTEYKTLVEKSRDEFRRTGCVYLPNFLTEETRTAILDEIETILNDPSSNLFQSSQRHANDLYQTASEQAANENELSKKTIIAFDQIPSNSLLRQIYASDDLKQFLVDVIETFPQLYPSRDELGACYVNIYRQSDQLSWHTDHSEFFVNLLLQCASEANEGVFQYKISADGQIFSRDDFRAGALVLFNGRKYLHRVTEVRHSTSPRINAILTFDSQENHRLSDYVREKFFGRI